MLTKLTLLKPEVKYLLIAECLDIITTFIGFLWGFGEGNPFLKELSFQGILIFKILATLIFAPIVLQKINFGKWGWIFPIIAIVPVFWNLYWIIWTIKITYFGW